MSGCPSDTALGYLESQAKEGQLDAGLVEVVTTQKVYQPRNIC